MCIREIPIHPWCTCPPSVHFSPSLSSSEDKCPHHVYISRAHPPLPNLHVDIESTENLPVKDLLDPSTFPGPRWVHCESYKAPDGTDTPGWELRCPQTVAQTVNTHNHAHDDDDASVNSGGYSYDYGYQRIYLWDGMCSACDFGLGQALPLIPVRKANPREDDEEEEQLVDPLTGTGWNDVADLPRLLEPDGSRVDEEVVHKMVTRRPDRSRDERVFVHIEHHRSANGVWEVDMEVSAIYLLPSSFPTWPATVWSGSESELYRTKSKSNLKGKKFRGGGGGCIPGLARYVAKFVLPTLHAFSPPATTSLRLPPSPDPVPRTCSDTDEVGFQVSSLQHE